MNGKTIVDNKFKEAEQEVEQMLVDLQLGDKRNELVDTLSGGMKRRLSVAIAFIGGNSVCS